MPSQREYLRMIPACVVVTVAAFGLWALGFKRYALPLATSPAVTGGKLAAADEALVRAISRTSRVLSWSTCLSRSCALSTVLRRRGIQARLHIGVARPATGLHAHAWVVLNGQAIGADGGQASQLTAFALGESADD